jgi:DNA-binding NtrC family response regulator
VSAAPAPVLATALVIDDEAMVRELVRRVLEPKICQVVEAPDGETGLRLLERSRDGIDVVLTDLLMPGIDGYDVVEVLTAHCPHLPVVCMSGFANHSALERRLVVPFLPKPFDAETLRGTLEPLLERSRTTRRSARADNLRAADERAISQALQRRAAAAHAEALDLVAAAYELKRRRAEPPPKR